MPNSISKYYLAIYNNVFPNALFSVVFSEEEIYLSNLESGFNNLPKEIILKREGDSSCGISKIYRDENDDIVQVIDIHNELILLYKKSVGVAASKILIFRKHIIR